MLIISKSRWFKYSRGCIDPLLESFIKVDYMIRSTISMPNLIVEFSLDACEKMNLFFCGHHGVSIQVDCNFLPMGNYYIPFFKNSGYILNFKICLVFSANGTSNHETKRD